MSLILACTFVASSFAAHPFMTVNQLILDADANRVELQASQTMATSNPMNWIFANREDLGSVDTMSIRSEAGGTIGAGFYGNAAHGFSLSDTLELKWVMAAPAGIGWFTWRCTE